LVVNEKLNSQSLDQLFTEMWKEIESINRYPLIELKVRRETPSPAVFEFLRQDHVTFWNHRFKNGSHYPLSALLITDTGNQTTLKVIALYLDKPISY
jgi:hypothetical protein